MEKECRMPMPLLNVCHAAISQLRISAHFRKVVYVQRIHPLPEQRLNQAELERRCGGTS